MSGKRYVAWDWGSKDKWKYINVFFYLTYVKPT